MKSGPDVGDGFWFTVGIPVHLKDVQWPSSLAFVHTSQVLL